MPPSHTESPGPTAQDWRSIDDPAERLLAAMGVGMAVAHWAELTGDNAAVLSDHGDLTFSELNQQANRLVRGLRRRGLEAGGAVALFSTNRPEFVATTLACQRGGWRLTPVNSHLTADEAAYIIGDCGAEVLIADGALEAEAGAATAEIEAARATPLLAKLRIGASEMAGFEDLGAFLADQDGADIPDPVPGNAMLYTSGTTGRPKGVHKPTDVPVVPNLLGHQPGDRTLVTGPLYHAGPFVVSMHMALSHGAGMVMMPRWDAEEALRLIERHGVTHMHVVPTMFHRWLALPVATRGRYELGSLRQVVHGAAPCPIHVKRAMIEWLGPIITEYYSSTEGFGSIASSDQWLARPGTVGRPAPPGKVIVGDEEARPLPAGTEGLLWLKVREQARFRYHGDDGKTRSVYRGEYFTLGDVGYMDEEGWLFLTDRSADLIISGGVNVYPAEVDEVLLGHPAVGDVATIGIPDEAWGESVLAVIEPQLGTSPSPELGAELVEFCRSRLAHYKCPRSVEFVAELPRTASGKVPKGALRERFRSR